MVDLDQVKPGCREESPIFIELTENHVNDELRQKLISIIP
jgi:hypothetical protein